LPADTARLVFIVLLDDEAEARVLADLLRGDEFGSLSTVAIPPVRGLGFFSDETAQPVVNRWWGETVHDDADPIFLMRHDPELADWLDGLDGVFVIGADAGADVAGYGRLRSLVVSGATPDALARAARRVSSSGLMRAPAAAASAFAGANGGEDAWFGPDQSRAQWPLASARELQKPGTERGSAVVTSWSDSDDPFTLLAGMSHASEPEPTEATRTSGESRIPSLGRTRGFRFPSWARREAVGRNSGRLSDADLAARLVERGATIVAVGSRKGGVGKTSHAAGMAIVAGTVLDRAGHRAAIVDANVANPDAWGQLNLPGGAATVRSVVAALIMNQEPPKAVYASTPALACYPESRETSEYSRTDIVWFAQFLRDNYSFVVVDLSNRLPDPIAGPEAAVAAFWLEQADCLVLPAASSKQDFNGVLDYLEVRDLPPAVVAYIVPTARRNREHPLTKRYLAAIGHRAHCIINIPDEPDRVRYAGMDGVPVQDVSPALGSAYRDLVQAVALTPKHRGT